MGTHRSSASSVFDFRKSYDSFSREVFYNTVTEFVIPMKIEIETKECPNEAYSSVFLVNFSFSYFLLRIVYK